MQKINFEDAPSRRTPINSTNLNAMQTNAENAINEAKEEVLNVELIAVTDTAPTTCSTGDKYFNTTDNLIYTATGTNTWGSTGESAVDGIMYIVYSKKSTYAYDGDTLISVGGGSGAYIGTTQPPQDDNSNVWINPNESVNVYGNYISNSYGTSQEIGYSQEYVNGLHGVELFSGNTNGDVALSDNPTNYKLLFVKHKNYDSGIVYNDVIINPILNELYAFTRVEVTSNQAYTFEKDYTINADKLVAGTAHLYALHDGTYSTYNNIRVLSVIGYK